MLSVFFFNVLSHTQWECVAHLKLVCEWSLFWGKMRMLPNCWCPTQEQTESTLFGGSVSLRTVDAIFLKGNSLWLALLAEFGIEPDARVIAEYLRSRAVFTDECFVPMTGMEAVMARPEKKMSFWSRMQWSSRHHQEERHKCPQHVWELERYRLDPV